MASEIPATTPTRLMIKTVVGGIKRVVHLKAYNSPKSSSSADLDVTEVGVNSSQNLQETLHNSKEMCWYTTNDPELLISPPFFNANSTPSELKNTCGIDRNEQGNEVETCKSAYLDHDEIKNSSISRQTKTVGRHSGWCMNSDFPCFKIFHLVRNELVSLYVLHA